MPRIVESRLFLKISFCGIFKGAIAEALHRIFLFFLGEFASRELFHCISYLADRFGKIRSNFLYDEQSNFITKHFVMDKVSIGMVGIRVNGGCLD